MSLHPSARRLAALVLSLFCLLAAPQRASAQSIFEGDTRLACEALLCLAAPARPGECIKSLTRYFSIRFTNPLKTITARLNFLQLCPAGDPSFVTALANGAGYCDAEALNQNLVPINESGVGGGIDPTMPAACMSYYTHPWLSPTLVAPKYVGRPDQGGYWVEAKDYPAAQAAWDAAHPPVNPDAPPAPEGGA